MAAFWFAVGALVILLFSQSTLAAQKGEGRSHINAFPQSETPGDEGDWSWGLPIPPSSGGDVALSPDPEFQRMVLSECRKEIISPQCRNETFDALVKGKSFSQSCCFQLYHYNQCYVLLVEEMLDTPELKPQATTARDKAELKMLECEDLVTASPPSDYDYNY